MRVSWWAVGLAAVLVGCSPAPTTTPAPASSVIGNASIPPSPSAPRVTPSPSPTPDGQPTDEPPQEGAIPFATQRVDPRFTAVATGRTGLLAVGQDRRGGVIWRATNGKDWIVAADDASLDNVELTGVAESATLSVAIGCSVRLGACAAAGVWLGKAGWHRASTGHTFDRATLDSVAVRGGTAVILGRKAGRPAAWRSDDGQRWTTDEIGQPGHEPNLRAVAATDAGFVAVGTASSLPVAWVSSDGRAWKPASLPPDTTRGDMNAVATFGDDLFAGGGTWFTNDTDFGDGVRATLWHSNDGGTTWQRIEGGENTISCCTAITSLAVGQGGILALDADGAWQSADGKDWTQGDLAGQPASAIAVDTGFVLVGDQRMWTSPTAELFPPRDPLAGVGNDDWTTLPPMPLLRQGFTAAVGPKGQVYVFSQAGGLGDLRVDRFEPEQQRWTRMPSLGAAILSPRAVAGPGGRIYLVGVATDGRHGRTLSFDPVRGTLRTLAPIPTPRESPAVTFGSDGRLYVLGGRAVPCCDGIRGDGALTVVERFDPKANSWTRRHPMPWPDASPSAVGSGGNVYLFLAARVWAYDIRHDTFTPGPATMTFGIDQAATIGADGLIRVFGCTRYDLFDPGTNHWQPGQLFRTDRCNVVAVPEGDGDILVLGGDYTGDPGRIAEAFYAGGG